MLARAGLAQTASSLNHQDLRGWHYVLTGGILGCLSPWGFDAKGAGEHTSPAPRVARYPSGYAWAASAATKAGAFGVPQPVVAS